MKRLYTTLILSVILLNVASVSSYAQIGGFWAVKTNMKLDLGFDIGVTINDRFGVKAGMISDLSHPTGDDASEQYEEALGKKYRLSYTAGPMVKVMDWMWISATAGYGEYGVYGYSGAKDMYGIKGKVKGIEAGLQLNFIIDSWVVSAGYGTIPKGFSVGRPLHDISIGVGMIF